MLESTTVEPLPTTKDQFNGEILIFVESKTVEPPTTELDREIPILLGSTTVKPPPSTTEQLHGPITTVAKETTRKQFIGEIPILVESTIVKLLE